MLLWNLMTGIYLLLAKILQVGFPGVLSLPRLVTVSGVRPPDLCKNRVQQHPCCSFSTFEFVPLLPQTILLMSVKFKPHLMQVNGRDVYKYSSEQNLKASTAQRGSISEWSPKLYFLPCLILWFISSLAWGIASIKTIKDNFCNNIKGYE